MTIRSMRIARWITKPIDTHRQFAKLTAFRNDNSKTNAHEY